MVTIADGSCFTGKTVCPQAKWQIQGNQFIYDFQIMELGGWDIILGVDWMFQYSPITFDFRKMVITLAQEGEELSLHGSVDHPSIQLVRGKARHEFVREQLHGGSELQLSSMEAQTTSQPSLEFAAGMPDAISTLLKQYSDVFATPKSLPPPGPCDHQIPLKPQAQPCASHVFGFFLGILSSGFRFSLASSLS